MATKKNVHQTRSSRDATITKGKEKKVQEHPLDDKDEQKRDHRVDKTGSGKKNNIT